MIRISTSSILDLPRIPLGETIVDGINFLSDNLPFLFDAIRDFLRGFVGIINDFLGFLPPLVLIAIIAAISWKAAKSKAMVFAIVTLLVVLSMNLWDDTLLTLSLVIVATLVALVIGIPLGILKARSRGFENAIEPVLDFMQTLPSLSYLIPAVLFFGIGTAPGVVATVIFSMPPAIRLTALGIQQVSHEMIEVGQAFGATSRQILLKIELPMAMPSIAMGINQTIMLAFSMVVIAGFIGSGGLGEVIISGIQRYSLVSALEAGLTVVFLAIILDRITKSIGAKYKVEAD